jgi:branched-chain amino acid transport system permease protein
LTFSSIVLQVLTGLASASALFLVASGLSLIFGVTRIVNFAHGSFYMLGLYGAVQLTTIFAAGPLGWWGGVLVAALVVAAFGALIESLVLRRLYGAPELYQLLATFALVLVIRDFALWAWGPEDILGPKAPGMKGAVDILGKPFPSYDIFSIFVGPAVLGLLWLLLTSTRWGLLVRAATQDREMVGALGVNQRWLFTSVFALGTFLAALGGALQMPHEPANLSLDLALIGEAFVVVVVGGMGSIVGAFVAAIVIAMVKAICIAAGSIDLFGTPFPLSKLTLVAEFLVMAIVLVWRPWGLFGKPQGAVRGAAALESPLRPLPAAWRHAAWAGSPPSSSSPCSTRRRRTRSC